MTAAKVRLAMAAMGQKKTKVTDSTNGRRSSVAKSRIQIRFNQIGFNVNPKKLGETGTNLRSCARPPVAYRGVWP
jgi:hypothetical protein